MDEIGKTTKRNDDDGSSGLVRREQIIGVFCSSNIRRSNTSSYCLLITNDRIAGTRKRTSIWPFEAYVGVSSGASEADKSTAATIASEILKSSEFVLLREKIFSIVYEPPTLFWGGEVIFKVAGEQVELYLTCFSPWDTAPYLADRRLLSALLEFDAGKMYDEKTGRLVFAARGEKVRAPANSAIPV